MLLDKLDTKKSKLTSLRPTKGANFRYKMNYEGKIEKCDLKKRSSSKIKKSMVHYKDFLEFKNKGVETKSDAVNNENSKTVQLLGDSSPTKDNVFDEMINEF